MTGVQGGGCARKCSASSKETLSLAQGSKSTLTEKGVREKRRQPWSPHQQDGARRCCELHSPRPLDTAQISEISPELTTVETVKATYILG